MLQRRAHPLTTSVGLLCCACVLPSAARTAVQQQPASVYWQASPVLVNETAVIAGAGFVGQPVTLRCGAADCAEQPAFDVWEQSVKFVLPADCGPPCTVRIGEIWVDVNAPDVWWSTGASAPVEGRFGLDTKPRAGQWLRVFGRSLAWSESVCVSAAAPHPRVPSTTLSLVPGQPGIVATNATCFEAWFSLMGVPAGAFAASLRTAWGSVTLNISVLPPLLPAAPTLIDVDTAHGGDIAVALLAAAAAPAPRRVRLGARVYSLNNTLRVPNGTSIEGAGIGLTTLEFVLPPTPQKLLANGSVVRCGFLQPDGVTYEFCTPALAGGDSGFMLADLALVVRSAPAGTSAVFLPPGCSKVRITRVNITLLQHNVSNVIRIGGGHQKHPIEISPTANWKVSHEFEVSHSTFGQYGTCQFVGFQAGVAVYIQTAVDGLFQNNTVFWRCGVRSFLLDAFVSHFHPRLLVCACFSAILGDNVAAE